MNMGVMNILSIQILEFFFGYIYAAFLPLIEDLSCVFLNKNTQLTRINYYLILSVMRLVCRDCHTLFLMFSVHFHRVFRRVFKHINIFPKISRHLILNGFFYIKYAISKMNVYLFDHVIV